MNAWLANSAQALLVSTLLAYKPSARMAVKFAVWALLRLICVMWLLVVLMVILKCH